MSLVFTLWELVFCLFQEHSRTFRLRPLACMASVPAEVDGIRAARISFSHSGRAKNGARAKRWKEGGGIGERRERVHFSPLTHLLPSTFLLSSRFSRGLNDSFARRLHLLRTGTLATQATDLNSRWLSHSFTTRTVLQLQFVIRKYTLECRTMQT